MKVELLSVTDARRFDATHRVTIVAADVAALGASTTGTLAILPTTGTFPAYNEIRDVRMKLITAFDASDAAINSLLIEIGDGGDTDRLLTQTEIAVDGTEILAKALALTNAYSVADTLDALFTVAGGGTPLLSEITSGELELLFNVIDLNKLPRNA